MPAYAARSRWHMLLAVVPCLAAADGGDRKPVPMRDLALTGSADSASKAVRMVIEASIATPFGRIPFRGHVRLNYDCASRFNARVSYHPVMRFLAKLKGVDLITVIDGNVRMDEGSSCPVLAVRQMRGRALVDVTQMSGWLTLDGDSLDFRGPAWMIGDSSYHSTLTSMRSGRPLELSVNMYER